jgi:hypothetical protein
MDKNTHPPLVLKLEERLEKLKQLTGLGLELEVCWRPDGDCLRHGEVKGNLIIIYDVNEAQALRTLRHEFIDYLITREIIDPLVEKINVQNKIFESMIYRRKELLVDRISGLLDSS